MKPTVVITLLAAFLALAGAALAQERQPLSLQEERRYVVSALAGGVNLVEGDVTAKKGQSDWSMVIAGDNLEVGELVKTGTDSRAEILLNPGSYLRLGENSEFHFDSVNLNNLRINLAAGSMIIEAGAVEGYDGKMMTINTPNGNFDVMRGGVYRFDLTQGKTQAEVFRGRLIGNGVETRDGNKLVLNGSTPEVLAFDRKDMDSLDLWSKDRAKTLVEANASLIDANATRVNTGFFGLAHSGFFSAGLFSDPFFSCTGLWTFSPLIGSYIFLPNGFNDCGAYYSPYGYGYYSYNCPFSSGPYYGQPVGGGQISNPNRPRNIHKGDVAHWGWRPGSGKSGMPGKGTRGFAKGSNSLGVQRTFGWGGGGAGRVSSGGGSVGRSYGGGGGYSPSVSSSRASSAATSVPMTSGGGHVSHKN